MNRLKGELDNLLLTLDSSFENAIGKQEKDFLVAYKVSKINDLTLIEPYRHSVAEFVGNEVRIK
jgi:hypothetical protein